MRQINVSVVGLSGTEKDKGQIGIGKSCLCNRFIRPLTDDYFIDHISVLSQSDFSGRIVNNDHFLYWGDVRKTSDDGVEYLFHVIEQTEFVDDATFQPFKVGKMESYIKRCTSTKIVSAEKLMYICKNQLGIEKEYEQKVIPDGRLPIDGFICIFDVSQVPNRSLEKQIDFVHTIISQIIKNKKPVVLVTTKNDEANELYIREAEKICQRKEYKGTILMVETSSHEAINIDLAFILLAQIIDKCKARTKIITYNEAARSRKELLDTSTEAVTRLIRSLIIDYHTLWTHGSKMLSIHKEWLDFLELFGQEAGQRIFRRHIKKLREENITKRLQLYMESFHSILQDIIPDLSIVNIEIDGSDWNAIRQYFKSHIDYEQYFFECDQAPWTDLSDVSDIEDDARIPFDVLDTAEAETVFKNHVNALQQEQKRLEWKKQFKKLLEEAGYVTPGKQLSEVRVLFMGRECFEALSEHDCQQIYDNHQKEIIDKAKHNFQELLLEHADLFYHFKTIEPSGTITQEDIKEITDVLQEDLRYKMLDRLDQDRKLMLFQHLGFVHCPIREHCPAFPNCIDALIERIITAKRSHSLSRNQWKASIQQRQQKQQLLQQQHRQSSNNTDNILNLLILGSEHLASDIINEICLNCGDDGEYIYDGQSYYLNNRILNNGGNEIETFKNIDFQTSGLICIYSNQLTLDYLKDNLERSLLYNLELEDKYENYPLVIVYQPENQKDDNELELLRSEGRHLSNVLHCYFVDTSLNFYHHRQSQHQNYIYDIINHLIECVRIIIDDEQQSLQQQQQQLQQQQQQQQQQQHQQQPHHQLHQQHGKKFNDNDNDSYQLDSPMMTNADIRIIMCMFCGDPYSIDNVLAPILTEPTCRLTGERSIIFETFLGDSKRKIEVIMSSYHGANAFRDELVHGFILLYSTKRRASLATLNAFSMNIPNLPMQLMAITDSGSANAFFNNDLCQMLITEGNSIADKLHGHFMTSGVSSQLKFTVYTPFLKEVWEKKPEIEQAFHMEEPVTLDSGEGTLEHSHHHLPQPPPRHESYMLKNNSTMGSNSGGNIGGGGSSGGGGGSGGGGSGILGGAGTDGSGSENYEHLPTRSLNSLNGPNDFNIKFNLNENIEKKYHHLYKIGGDKDMGIDDMTYVNDDDKEEKTRLLHQGFQIFPPPTTPPEPAPPDHHMAPVMRTTFKGNLVSASQSSLDDITSDVSGSKDSLTTHDSGWLDDALFLQRDNNDKRDAGGGGSGGRRNIWNNFGTHHAFTTGRHRIANDTNFINKVRPKGPSQTLKQPGKLNLKNFAIVNEAIARMNINSDNNIMPGEGDKKKLTKYYVGGVGNTNKSSIFEHAPLAAPEDDSDDLPEYAQVKDVYGNDVNNDMFPYTGGVGGGPADTTPNKSSKLRHRRDKGQKYSDSDSESSSSERKNARTGGGIGGSGGGGGGSSAGSGPGFDAYNKMNRKAQTHKRMRKKRVAIPVQPPKIPFGTFVQPPEIPMLYHKMKGTAGVGEKKMLTDKGKTMYGDVQEEESSIDVSSPRDNNSPIFGVVPKLLKDNDREKLLNDRKREKQKSLQQKEDEKLEKRRQKEDANKLRKLMDKEKEQEKKLKRKSKPNTTSSIIKNSIFGQNIDSSTGLSTDFVQSEKNYIPLILEKCVEFIEQEGLDSEGIYRVPGNRAHVDLLYQKFNEDPNVNIDALDIPVNAVATALKDFFSKHLPPLFDTDLMTELEEIAASIVTRTVLPSSAVMNIEVKTDRSCRLLALRSLLNKLPPYNFSILKYIFEHFVRVSENAKLNSMDSKNLAICWWPTLIPIEFTDMGHFEQLRPYLEDVVQTMIDQFPFLFCGKEAFVMV